MKERKKMAKRARTPRRKTLQQCSEKTRRDHAAIRDMSPAQLRLHLLEQMERVGTTMIQTTEQALRDEEEGLPIIAVTVPTEVRQGLRQQATRIAAVYAESKRDGLDIGCDSPDRVRRLLEAGFFYAIQRYAKDLRRNAELARAARHRDAAARLATAKKVSDRRAAVEAEIRLAAEERREIDVPALAAAHKCSRDTIYRDVRSMNESRESR